LLPIVGLAVGLRMGKLTTVSIKNAAPGNYQDGDGLIFQKTATAGKWTFRYSFAGRRRDMGLGVWPSVTLAEARRARDQWAAEIRAGRDPISTRNASKAEALAELDKSNPTFEEMAEVTFEARKARLRGDGERGRWFSPLRLHVIPKIGKRRMCDLHQADIKEALAPIWRTKFPTAKKAIERIRIVFETANLSGIDCDPQTVDRAQHMLGDVMHKPKHLEAMPWQDVPELYARLGNTSAHLALRWIILTLVRGSSGRGAMFDEIDDAVWTVPADRMKAAEGKQTAFRVPLSLAALEVARLAGEMSPDYLFQSKSGSSVISDVSLTENLRRLDTPATVHGFRTSFRMWTQDTQVCTYDVAETSLGHSVGGKVERAYARSDMLEQRRIVLQKWSEHVTGEVAKVVKIRA
jgi:integrase